MRINLAWGESSKVFHSEYFLHDSKLSETDCTLHENYVLLDCIPWWLFYKHGKGFSETTTPFSDETKKTSLKRSSTHLQNVADIRRSCLRKMKQSLQIS